MYSQPLNLLGNQSCSKGAGGGGGGWRSTGCSELSLALRMSSGLKPAGPDGSFGLGLEAIGWAVTGVVVFLRPTEWEVAIILLSLRSIIYLLIIRNSLKILTNPYGIHTCKRYVTKR